jgi:hypothetical protein
MAEITKVEDLKDKLTVKLFIDFLEYEEAFTKDKETASRIKILLQTLGIWN